MAERSTSNSTGMVQLIVTSDEMQKLLQRAADKTVLIDFTATWCGPCQKIKPLVHQLASQFGDQFIVCEVDVDKSETLRAHFDVTSMPTFVMVRHNKVIYQQKNGNATTLTSTMTLVASATHPHLLPG